ncbi:hypothetical protein ACIOGX_34640 [Streptomyces sp. NPDC088147]|uniref:hypothetical protein n=1 Tax=unclassified Streptomyces TaxID=2593676 RepID=UPI0033A77E40
MGVKRRAWLVAVSVVAAVVTVTGAGSDVGAGTGAGAGAETGAGAGSGTGDGAGTVGFRGAVAPEADLSHHGHVSLWSQQLTVRFESENHGPSGLADATVRLTFSVALAAGQSLPSNCVRSGDRVVLCRTGPLRAVGRSQETVLDLKAAGRPVEAVVEIDTAWNGGASDPNPENHRHRVLAPATGDPYAF